MWRYNGYIGALIVLDGLAASHHSAEVRKTFAAILWCIYFFGSLWLFPAELFFVISTLASLRLGVVLFYKGHGVLSVADILGWVLIILFTLIFLMLFVVVENRDLARVM